MLEVQGLAAERGDRRLFSGIDFTVNPGEMLYVSGANGSGKTTLLRLLCGLVLPEEGQVLWNGEEIRSQREAFHSQLCYFGHHHAIKDELSGLENLLLVAGLAGQSLSENEALTALEQIGLGGFEDLPTKVLSQGQKRRVALARLLLTPAQLWILDEPFTALDSAAIDSLRVTLSDHLARQGMIVLTTHQEVVIENAVVKQIRMGA